MRSVPRLLVLLLLCLLGVANASAADPSALLAELDARRSIPDMSFTLRIASYEGEVLKGDNTLWGFIKSTPTGNKSLLYFAEPSTVRGRKMLMDGNVVYMLFPRTRNPIRLSPLQVLLGEASNGDVARTEYSKQFDVVELREELLGGTACWVFSLSAKAATKDANYRKALLWADKATLRLQYAEFFNASDKRLKRAYFESYKTVAGKSVPMVIRILDGEDDGKRTVMSYGLVGEKKMPESYFRREYLELWTPEEPR